MNGAGSDPMYNEVMNKLSVSFTRRQVLQSSSALALAAVLPRCAVVEESCSVSLQPLAFADIPRSDYGIDTTADEVVANLDLSGMTVLITGCNSGLGYESLRVLAGAGAHVIGTARTFEKAAAACAQVGGKTTPLVCELTDMDSVTACAAAVNDLGKPLDVLITNAGIMAVPDLTLIEVNGRPLEMQFVVNHLGHYLLARQLTPSLLDARASRLVTVSSGGYRLAPKGGIQFGNLDFAGTDPDLSENDQRYMPFKAYGQSKLANVLMANEFSRRYFSCGMTANSTAPGVVATNLGRYISGELRDPDKPLGKGQKWPDAGAATQVYVAVDPRLANVSGYFFEDCNPVELKGDYAQDAELATRLWTVSEQLVEPWLS